MKKIILLPIREPWATKIIEKGKRIEFRNWRPNWKIGQEVWIIATGKAKSPREIIGSFEYSGYYEPTINKQFTKNQIKEWGGNSTTTGLIISNVTKFKKPLKMSLLIKNTPRKYMNIILNDQQEKDFSKKYNEFVMPII
ncbi:MAG: ASCH domain-containing protein [Mycoplasmatales bacterium]|nr:ASCH domain-containing protein [Mycoplasmatales bacterium]